MRSVSETCRLHGTGANPCCRWKDEAEQGTKARLEGEARQSRNAKKAVASGNRSARWGESVGDRFTWKCGGGARGGRAQLQTRH
jgi:hypothetical protein